MKEVRERVLCSQYFSLLSLEDPSIIFRILLKRGQISSTMGGGGGVGVGEKINSKLGKAPSWSAFDYSALIFHFGFHCQEVGSGPLCVICEFVMKELESMLDSNTTAAEIQAALDKVCSLLPSSITKDVSIC